MSIKPSPVFEKLYAYACDTKTKTSKLFIRGSLGLVSGVCLAAKGHDVICIDVLQDKVDMINRGESPIYEEGLEELLQNVIGKNLHASTNFKASILDTELTLITVGTPFDGVGIDLKYIRQVSQQIGEVLKRKNEYHTVIVKSTVVPGTTDEVVVPILEKHSGKAAGIDFGVGMNPEFLREGEAISDFMNPDRIVLGGIDDQTIAKLDEVYAIFKGSDIIRTTTRTAEMIKYTANSLLATLVSFSNEMGNLCAAIGNVDIVEVMRGVHLDKRFSPILESGERLVPPSLSFLAAGCGFGGSCLPKDVNALIKYGEDKGQGMSILKSVIETNNDQPFEMIEIVKQHFSDLKGLKVSVLGLSFKPGTNDVRDSASLTVIEALINEESVITAFDPVAWEETEKFFGGNVISYAESLEDCIRDADAVLLMTSWPQFEGLPKILEKFSKPPLFVDGRRFIDKSVVANYQGIGLS